MAGANITYKIPESEVGRLKTNTILLINNVSIFENGTFYD